MSIKRPNGSSSISSKVKKTQLRSNLRERRNALSAEQKRHAASVIAEHLFTIKAFKTAQNIALYLANDAEVSTEYILTTSLQKEKKCFLPKISGADMRFSRFRSNDALEKNKFGLLEPTSDTETIAAIQLDLVLVPLVGFDKRGYRLGMGGGYYDRYFKDSKAKNAQISESASANRPDEKKDKVALKTTSTPILVGLAYQCQCVETLPTDEWDIPLDNVISEEGMLF